MSWMALDLSSCSIAYGVLVMVLVLVGVSSDAVPGGQVVLFILAQLAVAFLAVGNLVIEAGAAKDKVAAPVREDADLGIVAVRAGAVTVGVSVSHLRPPATMDCE